MDLIAFFRIPLCMILAIALAGSVYGLEIPSSAPGAGPSFHSLLPDPGIAAIHWVKPLDVPLEGSVTACSWCFHAGGGEVSLPYLAPLLNYNEDIGFPAGPLGTSSYRPGGSKFYLRWQARPGYG